MFTAKGLLMEIGDKKVIKARLVIVKTIEGIPSMDFKDSEVHVLHSHDDVMDVLNTKVKNKVLKNFTIVTEDVVIFNAYDDYYCGHYFGKVNIGF